MPNSYPSDWIEKILRQHGFILVSQKGSHAKFIALIGGRKVVTIVPASKKDIPRGTFQAILKQSGLSKDDFAS